MIVRKYGSSVHTVDLDFDSKALTEIRFRKDGQESWPTDEFMGGHERVRGHELAGSAEGWVQDEVEQVLLKDLDAQVRSLVAGLAAGEHLMIESEQGTDYPKTTTKQKTVTIEGENKFHFTSSLQPPLRVAVYRKKGA